VTVVADVVGFQIGCTVMVLMVVVCLWLRWVIAIAVAMTLVVVVVVSIQIPLVTDPMVSLSLSAVRPVDVAFNAIHTPFPDCFHPFLLALHGRDHNSHSSPLL
jgi:hypothetical protein